MSICEKLLKSIGDGDILPQDWVLHDVGLPPDHHCYILAPDKNVNAEKVIMVLYDPLFYQICMYDGPEMVACEVDAKIEELYSIIQEGYEKYRTSAG